MECARCLLPWVAGMSLAAAASARYVFREGLGLDYEIDAGPPIDALARGDIGGFFDATPLMGSFSLLLRAPLAALAGGDELLSYRLGAFALLLSAGVLAVVLERLMARRGQPLAARLAVAALVLVNPVTRDAILFGHPEEPLGAALSVGAVVAALHRRPLAAGVLLGLALATKQWAVLAVLPVLLALDRDRLRTLAVAAGVAAVLTLPLLAANAGSFARTTETAAGVQEGSGGNITPLNLWWPLAEARELTVSDGVGLVTVERRSLPDAVVGASHVLIVLLAVPLAALFFRNRHRLRPEDALALLALLFLLRCLLDPWNNQYYHVPFLISLAAWEGLRRRGLPLATMLAATGMWAGFDRLPPPMPGTETLALYLAWSLPLAAWLAARLYFPTTVSSLGKRLNLSRPLSVTATRSSIRTPKAPAT